MRSKTVFYTNVFQRVLGLFELPLQVLCCLALACGIFKPFSGERHSGTDLTKHNRGYARFHLNERRKRAFEINSLMIRESKIIPSHTEICGATVSVNLGYEVREFSLIEEKSFSTPLYRICSGAHELRFDGHNGGLFRSELVCLCAQAECDAGNESDKEGFHIGSQYQIF